MNLITRKISPEVLGVLRASSLRAGGDEHTYVLTLPERQLERNLYLATAKTIAAAGGKWDRRENGFVFASDPTSQLMLAMESGSILDDKKTRQAFHTPAWLAAEVARLADVRGHAVLEPSAGDGALVRACLDEGAALVAAVEIHEAHEAALRNLTPAVVIADFLDVRPAPIRELGKGETGKYVEALGTRGFQRVVMNPPFDRRTWVRHIEHALLFLEYGGELVAITPDVVDIDLYDRRVEVLRRDQGAFKSSGTPIATRVIRIVRA